MPTQAAPIIWKGSHGPKPPVSSAEVNMPTLPRQKPNPGPSARPPMMMMHQKGSIPAWPVPSGRRAATIAASTPSMAIALAPEPGVRIWLNATASTTGISSANTNGASAEWATAADSGAATNGQKKAARPTRDATASAATARGCMGSAALMHRPPGPPVRP